MKKMLAAILLLPLLVFGVFAADSLFYGFDKADSVNIGNASNVEWKDSRLYAASTDAIDPQFPLFVNLDGDDYGTIYLAMSYDVSARTDGKSCYAQIFFRGTDSEGNALTLSEANSVKVDLPSFSTNGETVVLAFPMTRHERWPGSTINYLRVDPVNCPGSFAVDYLLIAPADKDILYQFDTGAEGWSGANLVSAPKSAFGLLSGATAANKTNGLIENTSLRYFGDDYQNVCVRMKVDGITESHRTLLYTDLVDGDGTLLKPWPNTYNGYRNVARTVSPDDNGAFSLYRFDLSSFEAYKTNFVTRAVVNVVEAPSADFAVDYVLFKATDDDLRCDFQAADFLDGWSVSQPMTVSDGALHYAATGSYLNPRVDRSDVRLEGDACARVEVVMRYETDENDPAPYIQLYYGGTDKNGVSFNYAEANSVRLYAEEKSAGAYHLYTADLANANNWAGSTINKLRFDFMKGTVASFDVAFVRFVTTVSEVKTVNEDDLTLSYTFLNDENADARGVLAVDFGASDASAAKYVRFVWQSGSETDGYADLEGYTVLRTVTGKAAENGWTIGNAILIPPSVTAVAAYVTDSEKTVKLLCVIPENKRTAPFGEPSYHMALTSDHHFGTDGGSSPDTPETNSTTYSVAHTKAKPYLESLGIDSLVAAGDITQWYGRNENANQWKLAEDYFKALPFPVYAVVGNHDVPSAGITNSAVYGESAGYTFDLSANGYFERFLASWLAYNEDAGTYSVNRYDGKNWYDTVLPNGVHLYAMAIPRYDDPDLTYTVGEEQLAWIDGKLYEDEISGRPSLVFSHHPLADTVGDPASTHSKLVTDGDALKAVFARHPSVVYTTGHMHIALDTDFTNVINGGGTAPTYIHDGGMHDVYFYEPGQEMSGGVTGAHGVILDFYDGYLLARGFDFMNGVWISRGLYKITLSPHPAVSAPQAESVSGTLTAYADNAECFEWYGKDGLLAVGKTFTPGADHEGFVALRAYDARGGYASTLYASAAAIPAASVKLSLADGVLSVSNVRADAVLVAAGMDDRRVASVKVTGLASDASFPLADVIPSDAETVKFFVLERTTFTPLHKGAFLDLSEGNDALVDLSELFGN